MKITVHGDLFFFRCEHCGCCFREAASKTEIASAGVHVPGEENCGVRMSCPDCGNSVIGVRRTEHDRIKQKVGEQI